MKISNSSLVVALGVIIVVVLGFGVTLFIPRDANTLATEDSATMKKALDTQPTEKETVIDAPKKKTATTPIETYPPIETLSSLVTRAELNAIINSVGETPTPEDILNYSVELGKAAVDSPNLDITACVSTPNVLHLSMSRTFTVSNGDDKDHQINYGDKNQNVSLRSKSRVNLTFPSPGNYPYRCDQSADFAGVFLVTP